VSQTIASDPGWSVGLAPLRRIMGLLEDAVFLLLAVLLVPVAILAVGAPLALLVRLLLDIVKRM
jgi:hypothetical protein